MQLRRALLTIGALLATASGASALPEDEARPLRAWEGRVAPPTPGLGPEEIGPHPLELTEGVSPLDARLADLAARERWLELADLLARVSDGTVAEGAVLRTDHPGQPLLGAREDVRRRLWRLPPQAREAYRALVDQRADLLLREGRLADAPLSDLLDRYGATRSAAVAARTLGERLLERGDLDGAALLWRRALADLRPGEDPGLETRLVALRSLLGVDRPGSLTPRLPDPPARWSIAWARRALGGDPKLPRAVAADGTHVFLTDHRGVIALEREDGGLRWRVPLRGDPRQQRLTLGAGQLLLVRRDRVVAIDCERGAVAWEHLLETGDLPARAAGGAEDRFHDAVATPSGFAALATREGQYVVVGLSSAGQPLFETRLWPDRAADVTWPVFPRWVLATKGSRDPDGNERSEDRVVAAVEHRSEAPPRWVVGDGRLAAIGDRIVLTVDGVVAAVSAAHGGVLWMRDNSFGVHVAGERNVLVQLAVGPFAVEAVTAAGNLVRLDPLDGASLALPLPPDGLYQDGDARPYVLNLSPLVLGWDAPDRGGFHLTAGLHARRVVRFAQGPLGPAALMGSTLALPDPEGLVLVDLVHGKELLDEPLPWTLGAAPVVVTGGLIVAAGPEGLVVLTPRAGEPLPKPPALDADLSLAHWIDLLSHPDWRVRLRAQDHLASVDAGPGDVTQLERAARDAATLDARDVARDLVEQARRRRLFADLGGRDTRSSLVRDLARGVNLVERLRELRDLVPAGDRPQEELRRQVAEADEPAVRHALLDLLLKVDGRVRDRLGAVLRDPAQPDALRAGCARALVAAVLAGAPSEPLRRALGADAPEETWGWVMEAVRGHPDPEQLLLALPELQRTFARPPVAREVAPAAALEALLDAAPRLVP